MPQFDISSFFSQVFWVLFFVMFFYFYISYYYLPITGFYLKTRNRVFKRVKKVYVSELALIDIEYKKTQIKKNIYF